MKQNLQLTTSQQLSLTPQLKQSLEILQLSNIELERLIEQELVENPLLDRNETQAEQTVEITSLETQENEWSLETDLRGTSLTPPQNSQDQNPIEQTVAAHESLREHLLSQVRMTTLSDRDQFLAEALIYSIDKDGYLNAELDEVTALLPSDLDIEVSEVSAVLSLIKTLDPIGVGATDLRERLLLLLAFEPSHENDSDGLIHLLASQLVRDYLPLLASRNFTELGQKLNTSNKQLADAVSLITGLNPRITSRFDNVQKNHLTPDVVIKRQGVAWIAELNPHSQQKLNVNSTYLNLLKISGDEHSSDFLEQHLVKARHFMKAVGSRYDTLLAVAKVITKQQQAFFTDGEQHMQAMVMSDISSELQVHESTVSRAVNGKYLQCPRGVFELKYFFSSSVASADGSQSSSTAIRSLIKKLVADESTIKPLSDNKIAKELEQQGHVVARRTVAKYRESLNIPPSSQRKTLANTL